MTRRLRTWLRFFSLFQQRQSLKPTATSHALCRNSSAVNSDKASSDGKLCSALPHRCSILEYANAVDHDRNADHRGDVAVVQVKCRTEVAGFVEPLNLAVQLNMGQPSMQCHLLLRYQSNKVSRELETSWIGVTRGRRSWFTNCSHFSRICASISDRVAFPKSSLSRNGRE